MSSGFRRYCRSGVASQPLFCMVLSGSTAQRQRCFWQMRPGFSPLTGYFTRWPLFLELFYERNFQRFGEVTLIRLIVLQRNQYSEAGKDDEVLIAIQGVCLKTLTSQVCVEGTCHVHVMCVLCCRAKKGGVRKGVNPTLVGVFAENRLPELLVCAQSLSPGGTPYSSFSAV